MAFSGFSTPQPQQQQAGTLGAFGTPQAAAPSPFGVKPAGTAFGAGSAPAFGAAAASAFGAASAPAFGATTAAPAFGAAFGAASAPAFGASSAPAFGAASAPAFGASSAPAFGAPASTPAASFSFAPAAAAASAPAGGTSAFNFAPAAASQPATAFGTVGVQQPQQQNQSITYSTKYDDMPQAAQKALEEIGREVSTYRDDCDKLDRDARLHDSLALKKSLEEETSTLKQSLQGMLNAVKGDEDALSDFKEKVHLLMRATESAVRTYQRSRLWREAPQQYKAGQLVPPGVQELLSSPVLLPSPYLEQAIEGFQEALEAYQQCVAELEQALPGSADAAIAAAGGDVSDEASVLRSLPLVVSHMHGFFVTVAARLEALHAEVQRAKDVFLAQRRAAGDFTDPFEEARRSEQQSASTSGAAGGVPHHHHHGHQHGHHHHHHAAPALAGTVQQGAPGALGFGAAAAAPGSPFGAPFGGAPAGGGLSFTPVASDLSRKNTAPPGGAQQQPRRTGSTARGR